MIKLDKNKIYVVAINKLLGKFISLFRERVLQTELQKLDKSLNQKIDAMRSARLDILKRIRSKNVKKGE